MKKLIKRILRFISLLLLKLGVNSNSKLFRLIERIPLYLRLLEIEKSKEDIVFETREKMYSYFLDNIIANHPMDYLEFGVSTGRSLKFFIERHKNSNSRFYGFDSFEGIPEAWGKKKAGSYSTEGNVPDVNDKRVLFEIGIFQETLPGFLERGIINNDKVNVIHLDADLYSSTLYSLVHLTTFLKPGDFLIFDEFGFLLHDEFKAFIDFCKSSSIEFKKIARTKGSKQLIVQLTENRYYLKSTL